MKRNAAVSASAQDKSVTDYVDPFIGISNYGTTNTIQKGQHATGLEVLFSIKRK